MLRQSRGQPKKSVDKNTMISVLGKNRGHSALFPLKYSVRQSVPGILTIRSLFFVPLVSRFPDINKNVRADNHKDWSNICKKAPFRYRVDFRETFIHHTLKSKGISNQLLCV